MPVALLVLHAMPTVNRVRAPLILCDGLGYDGYIWKYVERRFAGERRAFHVQ